MITELDNKVTKFLDVTELSIRSSALEQQVAAFEEEFEELIDAYEKRDVIEFVDAIGDTAFVLLTLKKLDERVAIEKSEKLDLFFMSVRVEMTDEGFIDQFMKLVESAVMEVCDSNLSKFDTTVEEATATVESYAEIGVDAEKYYNSKHELWIIKATKEQLDINGKHYFKNKILKSSTNFRLPYFEVDISVIETIFNKN